jgi:Zn-dependent protease with chaperone function
MPLLLVFALVAACLPIDWFEPPFDPPYEVALALTGGSVGSVLAVAFVLRSWVIRTLRRDPSRRMEVANVYGQWRRTLFFVNISTAAACVVGFGWGWLVKEELRVTWNGKQVLAPFAEFAVPAPYFVILVGCWIIYYDAERALHRAIQGTTRPFSPRRAYLLHNMRQFALMLMLPVTLVVTQQTLGRFAHDTTQSTTYRIASLAVVPALLLFMPLLMKPFLGLTTMPAGAIRTRLEALAERLNFRCADFLLWPTHGASANAMIAGLLPRVRYVIFTDRILEDLTPDELDAVLGHEVGHAKHGHIWLYTVFLALSLSVLAALMLLLLQTLSAATSDEWVRVKERLEGFNTWLLLPPVGTVAAYLFVVFGALSRRCERQADVYGCKAVSCGDPACTGHTGATIYPPGGNCLCPTGIRTFTQALERVGDLNGVPLTHGTGPLTLRRLIHDTREWFRAWLHGPIPRRVAYLRTLLDRPDREPRFQRGLFVFKCVLMLGLAAALVALGEAVGWEELFKVM